MGSPVRSWPPGRLRSVVLSALLLLPAIVVFAPGLGYPFVSLDDVHHVVQNPAVHDLSWRGLRYIFLEDTRDLRYFPLSYLSLAVDHALFGMDPRAFHATNLLLHLANTLLVARLVARVFRDEALAFGTALLFSIHPLQVESVAWIISRKNVLFLFFFLLSALAYLRFAGLGRGRAGARALALGGSAALYGLACLSKTAAITLPAALVIVDWARDPACRTGLLPWLRRSLPSKLAYLPVVAFVFATSVRSSSPNPFRTEYGFDALEWLVIVGQNLFFYVEKTVVPLGLGVFYPLPEPGRLPSHFPLFAAGGAAILAVAVWSWWRGRVRLFFGLGWYLVTIAPMAVFAAFFSDLPLLAADRYYYQSAAGLLVIPAAAALHLYRSATRARPLVLAATAGTILALVALAGAHRSAWRSTIALYEETLAHHPNREFQIRLALEYEAAGRTADAMRALDAARSAESQVFFMDFLYYRLRIARLHLRMHDFARAADELEAGIESTPNAFEPDDARTPMAYLYLAELRKRAGDDAAAARSAEAARRASDDPRGYFETTWIETMPGESGRFLEAWTRAHPEDGRGWYHYARLAELSGDGILARRRLERALALGYGDPARAPDRAP